MADNEGKYAGIHQDVINDIKNNGGSVISSHITRSTPNDYVIHASDINWRGYSVDGNTTDITCTGDLFNHIDNAIKDGQIIIDDEHKKLDSDGIRYELNITDGKLGFNEIKELTFSAFGGGSFEYMDNTHTTGTISYSFAPNNKIAEVKYNGVVITTPYTVALNNTINNS